MEKYYRIGNSVFPAKWLFNNYSVRRDGVHIYVGAAQFTCGTEHAASRTFDRIVAIMGAEDLCAEPAGVAQWEPQAGTRYFIVEDGGVRSWIWAGSAFDELIHFGGGLFRSREEAEAALAKMKEREQPVEPVEPAAEKRWKPEPDGPYWTLTGGKVVEWRWYGDEGDWHDREKFDAGLVFRTKEEAEAALAKMNNSA